MQRRRASRADVGTGALIGEAPGPPAFDGTAAESPGRLSIAPMTRLILVRHGESNVAVERLISSGRTCTGLSELGRRQAAALAERWSKHVEVRADLLVTSDYRRAIETADALSPVLGLPIVQMAAFGEHDPGPEVEGLTYAEFTQRYPNFQWDDDPYLAGFPGGETVAAFRFRVGTALGELLRDEAGKTTVIVCHGGVIDTIFRRLLNTPISGIFELYTLNTAVSEFTLTDRNTWSVVRYNDAAHLDGLPEATVPPHRD